MKRPLPIFLLSFAVLLRCTSSDQKARDAYNKRDYATALREWKPLAEQRNAFAQNDLGLMYYNGEGVPEDDKTAVKWCTSNKNQFKL